MKIWSKDATGADLGQPVVSYETLSTTTLSIPVLKDLVQAGDGIVLLAAGAASYRIMFPAPFVQPIGEYVVATFIATAITLFMLRKSHFYSLERLHTLTDLITDLFRVVVPGAVGGAACLLTLRTGMATSAIWAIEWTACGTILSSLYRALIGISVRGWLRAGRLDQNVAVVGTGDLSSAFIASVSRDKKSRTRVFGCYSPVPVEATDDVRGDLDTLVLDCRLHRVDAIAIALPASQSDLIRSVVAKVRSCIADVFIVSDLCRLHVNEGVPGPLDISPVVSVIERPLRDWKLVQKAVFDRVVAALLLTMLLPILLVVALLIRLEGPGPILFRQMRMGLNNNLFRIYKFRTMHSHMTDRLSFRQTSRFDPRVTRVGRVIRRLSIDELPQLLNVLLGDMSLVGPRPHAPGTRLGDRKVDIVVATYAQRHRVKPGITGLAQVSGYRGEMTTEEQVIERIKYDLEYIDNWSIWQDIKIMFLTVLRESRSRNAY